MPQLYKHNAQITALTAIVKRRELLRNEIGKRIVMALCLGTFSFPLVVLATWAHLPAGQEEVQAQLVMSLDILFVALTFALVFPAIKTGLYIAISALCCFGVTLIAPEYTHAVLLIVGCISAFGLLFDWIKEQ